MLQDAEKFKAEDEAVRKRVEIRNQLEAYLYGCKTVRHLCYCKWEQYRLIIFKNLKRQP